MLDQKTTPTMALDRIKIGSRARRDLGDITALAADIDAIGLLQPVVVSADGDLIAGRRRIEAWKHSTKAKLPIPVHVVDLQAIVRGEWSENFHRKQLAPSEAVAIARVIEPMVRQEARKRQAHGKTGPGKSSGEQKEPRIRTRDVLAAHCGLSGRTLNKAIEVVAAADRDPALRPVVQRMDETGNVDAAYRTVIAPATRRALAQPSIFRSTKIGNVSFGDMTAPEIRWLFAFVGVLTEHLGEAPYDGAVASQLFTEKQVERAAARADRARSRR